MIVRKGGPDDAAHALRIWRAAVDATHGFLSPADRVAIDKTVAGFLPHAPLWIVDGDEGLPAGFMIVDGNMIEALFVDPQAHGRGIGTALVAHALTACDGEVRVDANEQADNALPFYLARDFRRIGRSSLDADGRPYPIVHLAHRSGVARA